MDAERNRRQGLPERRASAPTEEGEQRPTLDFPTEGTKMRYVRRDVGDGEAS